MEVMNSTTSSNGAGMIAGNASFLEFLNSKIHDAGAGNCSTYANQGCYGFYINGHDNLIDGCQIYNNGGFGLHMYSASGHGVDNNIIRNSIFYGNGFNDARGLVGSGLLLSSGDNNVAYNNIAYSNAGDGISVNCTNCAAYNNTVYSNQFGIGVNSVSTNAIIRNNIAYQNGNGSVAHQIVDWGAAGIVVDHNLVAVDPYFVNASAHNFSLQAGSPGIDAGATINVVTTDIQGIARSQGAAYDIGAYEYSTGSTPLPTPSNLRLISVSP